MAAPDMAYWLILVVQFDEECPMGSDPALPAFRSLSGEQIFLDETTIFAGDLGQILNGRIDWQYCTCSLLELLGHRPCVGQSRESGEERCGARR